MSDDYEIGITLALDNGVADGIAAVRKDLSALDQAMAASTAGLARLREVASGVLASADGEVRRAAGLTVAPRPEAAPVPREATAPLPDPSGSGTAQAQAPQTVAQAPSAREPAVPPAASTTRTMTTHEVTRISSAAPVAPPVMAPVAPMAPTAPAPSAERSVVTAAPVVAVAPVSVVAAPTSAPAPPSGAPTAVAPPRPTAAVPTIAPAVAPAAPTRVVERAVPRAPELAALGRSMLPPTSSGTQAAPIASVMQETAQRGAASGSAPVVALAPNVAGPERQAQATGEPSGDQEEGGAVAAPFARQHTPPREATSTAPSAATVSAAPQRQSGEQRPMSGDVVLDGQKVGRWMSDRITRDAGRPPNGPTGFDASRSPAWPGAAIA